MFTFVVRHVCVPIKPVSVSRIPGFRVHGSRRFQHRLHLRLHIINTHGILIGNNRDVRHIIQTVVHSMLALFKAGAAHGKQILAALKGHLLAEVHLVLVTVFDRTDLRPLKHGVGTG